MMNNSKIEKQLRDILKGILVVLVGWTLVFAFGACQNNKPKSSPPPAGIYPPNYYPGNYGGALCPTCNMNVPWTIFAGTDSTSGSGSLSLGLDFYGNPNAGFNFYDPRIPVMYTGPVVVRGLLQINTVDSLICSVPVGQYQITSLSAGQWTSGVVSSGYSGYGPTSLHMVAQSQFGVAIILRLEKAVIYNPSGTYSWYPNKLGGTLVFESVNNAPCYTYSGLPAYAEMY